MLLMKEETLTLPHICEEKVRSQFYVRADLYTMPLPDPDMTIFCDDYAYRAREGHVVFSDAVVGQLPSVQHHLMGSSAVRRGSAQEAEAACQAAKRAAKSNVKKMM